MDLYGKEANFEQLERLGIYFKDIGRKYNLGMFNVPDFVKIENQRIG